MAQKRRYEGTEVSVSAGYPEPLPGIGLIEIDNHSVTQVSVRFTCGRSAADLAAEFQDSANLAESRGDLGMQAIPANLIESVTIREVKVVRLRKGIR